MRTRHEPSVNTRPGLQNRQSCRLSTTLDREAEQLLLRNSANWGDHYPNSEWHNENLLSYENTSSGNFMLSMLGR